MGGESKAFTYDLRGRLRTEDLAGNSGSLSGSYAFDNSDNLQGGTGGWTYNTSNQVTNAPSLSGLAGGTGLAYDNAGNLTSFSGTSLTWDDLNRLASVGGTTFTTDAAGRRVSKTTGGVTTYFVYDGYTPIAELNSSGQVVKGYVWGPAGLVSDQVSGQTRFYLYDGIGNTRSLISATGVTLGQADYSAFGSVLATSGQTTPFGWQGQSGAYTDSESGRQEIRGSRKRFERYV